MPPVGNVFTSDREGGPVSSSSNTTTALPLALFVLVSTNVLRSWFIAAADAAERKSNASIPLARTKLIFKVFSFANSGFVQLSRRGGSHGWCRVNLTWRAKKSYRLCLKSPKLDSSREKRRCRPPIRRKTTETARSGSERIYGQRDRLLAWDRCPFRSVLSATGNSPARSLNQPSPRCYPVAFDLWL